MSEIEIVYKPSIVAKALKYLGYFMFAVTLIFIFYVLLNTDEFHDTPLFFIFLEILSTLVGGVVFLAASIITEAASVYCQKHSIYDLKEEEEEYISTEASE